MEKCEWKDLFHRMSYRSSSFVVQSCSSNITQALKFLLHHWQPPYRSSMTFLNY
uniref:Bm1399, isoform a n=1 Tax=Brugia malayi TaxID=6279 RepID=A0A1I9G3B5_BRUMA|nr:Bm1399, isoform a [Brugia malayi]